MDASITSRNDTASPIMLESSYMMGQPRRAVTGDPEPGIPGGTELRSHDSLPAGDAGSVQMGAVPSQTLSYSSRVRSGCAPFRKAAHGIRFSLAGDLDVARGCILPARATV